MLGPHVYGPFRPVYRLRRGPGATTLENEKIEAYIYVYCTQKEKEKIKHKTEVKALVHAMSCHVIPRERTERTTTRLLAGLIAIPSKRMAWRKRSYILPAGSAESETLHLGDTPFQEDHTLLSAVHASTYREKTHNTRTTTPLWSVGGGHQHAADTPQTLITSLHRGTRRVRVVAGNDNLFSKHVKMILKNKTNHETRVESTDT